MSKSMDCPCGAKLEWPVRPKQLYVHRNHLIEDGAQQLRINFNRKAQPDGARSIGFDF